jgi:Xaa-Pro aminopeptidase
MKISPAQRLLEEELADHNSNMTFSRRKLLLGASAGIAVSTLQPAAFGWGHAQQGPGGSAMPRPSAITPESLPKAWTPEEIHRRWTAVRQKMKEANLDALLVCQHHSGEMITERQDGDADVEYLTGITLPFKWVVLPHEGKVTALSTNQVNGTREEKLCQERGIDLRIARGPWSALIIDALREANLTQARIGVTDLVDASRQTEGEVTYTTYDRVLKAFPQAKFEPASYLIDGVAALHSAEEIAVLEKSTQVGELGLQAMFETARPGVVQRTVWLAMFNAMVNASGERPFRVSVRADGGGNSALNRPLEEVMRAGQVLSQECSACVLGYGSQVNHSVVVGSPAPADWDAAAKDSLDTFHEMVALVAPGKTVKDICAPLDKRLVARGEKPGALVIHSGGLGTLPRGGSTPPFGQTVVQAGMVFDVKPTFQLKNGGTAQFGDSIVVTDTGARRLGKREMKVVKLMAS